MLNGNYDIDNFNEIYGDKVFDIILLEHCNIKDYKTENDFLSNLYMVLKKDGFLILPVFNDDFKSDLFSKVGEFHSKFNGLNYMVLDKNN